MSDQFKAFKRIVKLHSDTSSYYQRCSDITTEADLTELFDFLSQSRLKMAHSLLSLMPDNERKDFWRMKEALSYLQRIWVNVKIALIVNDRSKILKYCHKAEQDAIYEYDRVLRRQEISEEMFRQITGHQQRLKEMISRIENTPVKKCFLQKRLAA